MLAFLEYRHHLLSIRRGYFPVMGHRDSSKFSIVNPGLWIFERFDEINDSSKTLPRVVYSTPNYKFRNWPQNLVTAFGNTIPKFLYCNQIICLKESKCFVFASSESSILTFKQKRFPSMWVLPTHPTPLGCSWHALRDIKPLCENAQCDGGPASIRQSAKSLRCVVYVNVPFLSLCPVVGFVFFADRPHFPSSPVLPSSCPILGMADWRVSTRFHFGITLLYRRYGKILACSSRPFAFFAPFRIPCVRL